MLKTEFETLAGYEVSYDDYEKIIEPMYMATNLDKEDFIKCISKKRFALKTKEQLYSEMKKTAKQLKDTCEHYADYEARKKLEGLVKEYRDRFYRGFSYSICDRHTGEDMGIGYRGGIYPYRVALFIPDIYDRELSIPLI